MPDRNLRSRVVEAYNRGRADYRASIQTGSYSPQNPYHATEQAEQYDAWDRAILDALSGR